MTSCPQAPKPRTRRLGTSCSGNTSHFTPMIVFPTTYSRRLSNGSETNISKVSSKELVVKHAVATVEGDSLDPRRVSLLRTVMDRATNRCSTSFPSLRGENVSIKQMLTQTRQVETEVLSEKAWNSQTQCRAIMKPTKECIGRILKATKRRRCQNTGQQFRPLGALAV